MLSLGNDLDLNRISHGYRAGQAPRNILECVAIDQTCLNEGVVDLHVTRAGIKRALKAATGLKEMIVVHDIAISESNYYSMPRQIDFYDEFPRERANSRTIASSQICT